MRDALLCLERIAGARYEDLLALLVQSAHTDGRCENWCQVRSVASCVTCFISAKVLILAHIAAGASEALQHRLAEK